jgi:tRNA threonylcarbamoyl adenosine modification protein YeaZ
MILSFHTAGMETTLQLLDANGETLAIDNWVSGRTLSDDILSHITALIQTQNIKLSDLTGIIILSGPGSFTSLRIGHSVANALADGLQIPIVGSRDDDWLQEGLIELKTSSIKEPALPFYGAEPNITKPSH